MRLRSLIRSLLFAVFLVPVVAMAQETDYDSLLQRIDTVENPVYKPVISVSYGILNFRGDVKNALITPAVGNSGAKINVATFVDRQHHFVANFNFLIGNLSGAMRSTSDPERNLNFRTQLSSIGANVEYRFGHWIRPDYPIRPYVTAGIESLNFSSKGDLFSARDEPYHYWSDGSIRNQPESAGGTPPAIYRDYVFETDLRLREDTEFGMGDYSERSLSVPVGLGAHYRINERAFFSLGLSYHYTFTDYLDNVASEGTSVRGDPGNDAFVFTHLSAHFDLFSDPATRTVDLLYADAEFDPLFFDDEDGDFVLDVSDRCPGTPFGVEVDTTGCPVDTDRDGVGDYMDREPDTAPGAWVDEEGVTVTEEEFYDRIASRDPAMARGDVDAYFASVESDIVVSGGEPLPERFRELDEDQDGYLSFDELLKTVDLYFDFQLDMDLDGLRDVNQFFFDQ